MDEGTWRCIHCREVCATFENECRTCMGARRELERAVIEAAKAWSAADSAYINAGDAGYDEKLDLGDAYSDALRVLKSAVDALEVKL